MAKNIKKETEDQSHESQTAAPASNIAPIKLELLITIVDKNKAEYYADLLQSFDVSFQFMTSARGTAKEDVLDLLGLADTDKAVIFSVARSDRTAEIMYTLERKFSTIKGGKGVSVSVPFTSMIGKSAYAFLANVKESVRGTEYDRRKRDRI